MSAVKTIESSVVKTEAKKTNALYVGRAWVNTKKDAEGKVLSSFINISIDKSYTDKDGKRHDITAIELKPGMKIQLWPNKKREGKQDADLRLSIVETVA